MNAKETTIELTITGMSCKHCAATVQRALSGVAGVKEASVDLESARATVRYAPDSMKYEDLVSAVQAAGYGVS